MVPPASHGIPRVPRYSGSCLLLPRFVYRALTVFGRPSHAVRLDSSSLRQSLPLRINPKVWPPPRSLATTFGISFDFSSSPYLDVSVREVPLVQLWIHCTITDSSSAWFPNSDICGSTLICSSPQLFAACHVLLRLLMPRHSPCALLRLNFFLGSLAFPHK